MNLINTVLGDPKKNNLEEKRTYIMKMRLLFAGTTWMQHTVWLLLNDLDYEVKLSMDERSPFLE